VAEVESSVINIARRFLDTLGGKKRIIAAYLYGSYARGRASEWSDIDVAVVSSDFTPDLLRERVSLMEIAATIDPRLDPKPFRPQDFILDDPLVYEIQLTGMLLTVSNGQYDMTPTGT